MHSPDCIPNPAYLAVRKVKQSIKRSILEDPTQKPGQLYVNEVTKVRDELGKLIFKSFIYNLYFL